MSPIKSSSVTEAKFKPQTKGNNSKSPS